MGSVPFLTGLVIAAGICITLQAHFMGMMDKTMGTRESVLITYVSGALIALAIVLLTKGVNFRGAFTLPWYTFTSGLVGLVIVGTIGFVVPRIGLAAGFTALIGAQFVSAALIDHWGLLQAEVFPIDLSKIIGISVMLVGIWLVLR